MSFEFLSFHIVQLSNFDFKNIAEFRIWANKDRRNTRSIVGQLNIIAYTEATTRQTRTSKRLGLEIAKRDFSLTQLTVISFS